MTWFGEPGVDIAICGGYQPEYERGVSERLQCLAEKAETP